MSSTHFDNSVSFATGAINFGDVQEKFLKVSVPTPADGDEVDTGIELPADCIVTGIFVNVTTAEATGTTKTLDVGLLSSESGGDADGFLDGADVSATGLVAGTLDSAAQTLGVLLSVDEDGAGALVPEGHMATAVTARTISHTPGSADFAELEADIYIRYLTIA